MVFTRQPDLASVCPEGNVPTTLEDAFEFDPVQAGSLTTADAGDAELPGDVVLVRRTRTG